MIEVDVLFSDKDHKTGVLISHGATEVFSKYRRKENPPGAFLKKLKRYAQNGFDLYVGADRPIRPEWDGVFRIGDSSLFRLIGFFEDGGSNFIITDGYLKRGQKLDASDRDRIDEAARVKKQRLWKRRWVCDTNK